MKKLLPLLLPCSLLVNICFAQQRIEYANFIQTDTAIKWAAVYSSYVNLTPINPNFSIRNFYMNKLKKQGAITYLEDTAAFAVVTASVNYDQFKAGIKKMNYNATKMNWRFSFDENPDAFEALFNQESNPCDTCALINRISLYKIKQLLFYKNYRLQVRNILLCPVIYKKTDTTSKEETEYFETSNFAFDEIHDDSSNIPSTATFICRSGQRLNLLASTTNTTPGNSILTLHNWNLTSLLYKDIKQQKIKAYDTENSIYPNPKKILNYRKIEAYKVDSIVIPVYDSPTQGEVQYIKTAPEINFDSLCNYTLIQDFYFDFEREKLYSKVVAFVPSMPVVTSQGIFLGYTDYWGVIFPEEKKKVANKPK